MVQGPLQPGEKAPDFAVPAVQDDRTVSLADYRDRSPLLLGLFPGLFCPFCRRALAQMAASSEKLRTLGIESLAIVGTELDNARLFCKYRPTRLSLAADPHRMTHRLYGVRTVEPTPELMQMMQTVRINPTGELPEPLPIFEAAAALDNLDRYPKTETDKREAETQFTQLKGQFLIGRSGVIRWANIECGKEGLSGVGKFPTHDELMTAARMASD